MNSPPDKGTSAMMEAPETQEQVAEAVGLEPGTISRIERGAKGMSIDSLLMFSEIYGVSTDYILKGGSACDNI